MFYTLAGNMVGKWNMTEADLEDLQKTLDLPNQALEKATKAEEVSDKICCMFEEWLKTSPVKTRSHLESCLKPLEKRLHQRAEKVRPHHIISQFQ